MKLFQDRALEALSCKASSRGTGLREIQLSPPGTVTSKSGTFVMDAAAGRSIVEAFKAHGNAVPLDWDHATLEAPPGHAPASGFIHKIWFDRVRGLMALVEWTPAGRRSIQDGSYRYLSPVFMVNKQTKRPELLHSAALTNKPAIPRAERIVASETFKKKELWTMAEEPNEKKSPEAVLGQIAGLLNVESGANPLETLEAILEKVKDMVDDGEGDEGDTGAVAIANAIRTRLELPSTAGAAEVSAAMSISMTRHSEVNQLRADAARRTVDDLLRPYIGVSIHPDSNYPGEKEAYQDMVALCERDPAAALRLLERFALPPQGRTTAPNQADMSRANLIKNAERDFRADESLRAATTAKAYVSLMLRDRGLGALTDTELLTLAE